MKTKSLTQVCNITTGKLDANAGIPNGKYPFFTCAPDPLRIDTFAFDDDVVLLAGNNAQGNFHIQRFKGKFNAYQRTYVITARDGYDIDYVKYSLELSLQHLKRIAQGSQTKFLTMQILDSFRVVDIAYDAHRHLIGSIREVDSKISLNTCICAELESMAKTLYDYWFTQFDFPDENGKPYRSSGGEMVWNDQLKCKIPKGWTADVVGNLLSKVPNTTRIQTGDYLNDGDIPVVDQSTDFIAGYTNDTGAALSSPTGYIVFGDHTRIVKYVRFSFARGADGTQVLKSNTPRVPDELLYQIIKSIDLSNYGYARHFKFLKDTTAIIPDESVAKRYAEIVIPIYDKQVQLIFENRELTKLRDWLLPMLMNGQAAVSD